MTTEPRKRPEIGRDLEAGTMRADQVGRLLEITADWAGGTPPIFGHLEYVENLMALLAGASALLRETSADMRRIERELIEAPHAGES